MRHMSSSFFRAEPDAIRRRAVSAILFFAITPLCHIIMLYIMRYACLIDYSRCARFHASHAIMLCHAMLCHFRHAIICFISVAD